MDFGKLGRRLVPTILWSDKRRRPTTGKWSPVHGDDQASSDSDVGSEVLEDVELLKAGGETKRELEGLLDAEHKMSEEEREEREKAFIRIIRSPNSTELIKNLVQCIKQEWCVSDGIEELPGDVYSVMALNSRFMFSWPYTSEKAIKSVRKCGCLLIIIIQLLGPPLIFFQMFTGLGIEDSEKLHWDKFAPGSKYTGVDVFGHGPTELMAVLFLIVFLLNGVFCLMDTTVGWTKNYVFLSFVNENDPVEGTCLWFLRLGAFVNTWVIVWLSIDMYFVMGVSDTVQDVLMDALGLAFLYNLDDVGGDLGFIDADDWPGLQIAWIDQRREKVAKENENIEDAEADASCVCYLHFITAVLVVLTFTMPVLFMFTPFKEMKPDPFFQELIVSEQFVNATRAAVSVTS